MGVTGYFCHRMGFGSGDMLAQRTVQYDEGLANAGVRLFQPVADFYRRGILAKKECFERVNRDWWKWSYRFPEPATKDDEFAKLVAGHRDLPCLVAIGRNCGESVDLSAGGETGTAATAATTRSTCTGRRSSCSSSPARTSTTSSCCSTCAASSTRRGSTSIP